MEELDYLKERIELLESEVDELKNFFDSKSDSIFKKCVRGIERSIRKQKVIPNILSDDYDYLNTFEQICYIIQEREVDDYFGLENYIDNTVDDVYENLSIDEKFIINHGYCEDAIAEIRNMFNSYCVTYSNKKIRRAIYE